MNLDLWYIQNVLIVFDSWGPLLKETDWCYLVTLGHYKKFKLSSEMATKNTSVANLAITIFTIWKCLINAHFITYSCINATEEVNVTLGHLCSIEKTSKIADSRFIMWLPYFFQICINFFEAQTFIYEKILDISTNLIDICTSWSAKVASNMGRLNWNGNGKGLTIKYQTKWDSCFIMYYKHCDAEYLYLF